MEVRAKVPEARYRIDGLRVEGFKAFSVSQEIAITGRHCFLFGANARGKGAISRSGQMLLQSGAKGAARPITERRAYPGLLADPPRETGAAWEAAG